MPNDNIEFIQPTNQSLLAYLINNQILVMMNSGDKAAKIDSILLPKGEWELLADINEINLKGINKKIDFKLAIPAQSLYIFKRK
jgi:hypothetical protein